MKRAELLIDPVNVMVGTDQGIDWVCDRYILVRADLFTRPPKDGDTLLSRHIRSTLAPCRTTSAYARHLYNGQKACEPCLKANRESTYTYIRAIVAGRSIA